MRSFPRPVFRRARIFTPVFDHHRAYVHVTYYVSVNRYVLPDYEPAKEPNEEKLSVSFVAERKNNKKKKPSIWNWIVETNLIVPCFNKNSSSTKLTRFNHSESF